MKTTVEKLLGAKPVLNKIFSSPMDFKTAYRLKRIAEKVNSGLKDFDTVKDELVTKFGEVKEGRVSVPPASMEKFQEAMKPVFEKEIDLDIELIPISMLEKAGLRLSANDLISLDKFIKNDTDGPELIG